MVDGKEAMLARLSSFALTHCDGGFKEMGQMDSKCKQAHKLIRLCHFMAKSLLEEALLRSCLKIQILSSSSEALRTG